MKRGAAYLLGGLALFILVGWGVGALWTSSAGSSELDFMREVSAQRSRVVADIARTVTWAGSALILVPLALVACALLVRAGLRAQALAVALTLGGAMIIANAVKVLVARPRPPVEHLQAVSSFSFPSVHAAQASAFWLSLVFAAHAAGLSAFRTSLLAAAALLIVVLVGLSRICLGVHYPSDVVAGVLLGGGWAAYVASWRSRFSGERVGDEAHTSTPSAT